MADCWTPCKHYANCIGYCPFCIEEQRQKNVAKELLSRGEPIHKNQLEEIHWKFYAKPLLERLAEA